MNPRVTLIVAATDNEVIGDRNDLPWHLPDDLKRFKRLTMGHTVVMGRLTHESILRRLGKPMPGRQVVVVTTGDGGGLPHADSVSGALDLACSLESADEPEVFIGGGAQVYVACLPFVDRILLTRVHADIPGDTAMPAGWLAGFQLVASEDGPAAPGGPAYTWLTYERD